MRFAVGTRLIFLVSIITLIDLPIARAHHLRGLPHYSYKSSHPQVPVYEVVEPVDQYLVTFTYYKIPGQKALDLAIYIRNSADDTPFGEPVTIRVFGKHEDPELSHDFTAYRNPTNIYKVGWVYENDGDYYVRMTFTADGKTHNVLFELTVGDENRVWYLLAGALLLVVAFALVTGIMRRRSLSPRLG